LLAADFLVQLFDKRLTSREQFGDVLTGSR
jgi:hypothetical protein